MLGYRLKGEYFKSGFAPCSTYSAKQVIYLYEEDICIEQTFIVPLVLG